MNDDTTKTTTATTTGPAAAADGFPPCARCGSTTAARQGYLVAPQVTVYCEPCARAVGLITDASERWGRAQDLWSRLAETSKAGGSIVDDQGDMVDRAFAKEADREREACVALIDAAIEEERFLRLGGDAPRPAAEALCEVVERIRARGKATAAAGTTTAASAPAPPKLPVDLLRVLIDRLLAAPPRYELRLYVARPGDGSEDAGVASPELVADLIQKPPAEGWATRGDCFGITGPDRDAPNYRGPAGPYAHDDRVVVSINTGADRPEAFARLLLDVLARRTGERGGGA